jgi:hypothetical protein
MIKRISLTIDESMLYDIEQHLEKLRIINLDIHLTLSHSIRDLISKGVIYDSTTSY